MRGYCAIGRYNSAIPPISVITIDSTDAKIGRSMKKREIMAGGTGEFRLLGQWPGERVSIGWGGFRCFRNVGLVRLFGDSGDLAAWFFFRRFGGADWLPGRRFPRGPSPGFALPPGDSAESPPVPSLVGPNVGIGSRSGAISIRGRTC